MRISRSPLFADLLHVDILPWFFFARIQLITLAKFSGALKPKFTLLDSSTESSAFKHGVSFALLAISFVLSASMGAEDYRHWGTDQSDSPPMKLLSPHHMDRLRW